MKTLSAILLGLVLAMSAAAGDYVILVGVNRNDPYFEAAKLLARHHKCQDILRFNPEKPEAIVPKLRQLEPAHVALVVRPEQIDVNSVRAILKMSTTLDKDPFPDFAYGFITGATAADAQQFVKNIIRASKKKHPRKIGRASVRGGKGKSSASERPYRAGELEFPMRALWFVAPGGRGSRDQAFIDENLKSLGGLGAILMGGHGMPWEIGSGPRAEDVAGVILFPAVVFNYACYTGVTHRYPQRKYQGGSYVIHLKEVEAEKSFALSVIGAGATGYTAYVNPRPAGPELSVDFDRVLAGSTLGDARRNDYNKIVLGYLGFGEAGIAAPPVKDGEKKTRDQMQPVRHLMLDGATGGILYGDPAFRPYPEARKSLPLKTEVKRTGKEIQVTMRVSAMSVFVWCSDPFRQFKPEKSRAMAKKIYGRIEMTGNIGKIRSVRVKEATLGGSPVETLPVVWAEENDRGRRFLHLKANFEQTRKRGEVVVRLVASEKAATRRKPRKVASAKKKTQKKPQKPAKLDLRGRGNMKVLWTVEMKSDSKGGGAAADIDGDGKLEIVFGTYFGDRHVYAVAGESGKVQWKFESDRGPLDASIAICNLDRKGGPEILAADSSSGSLFCLDGKGKEKWRIRLPNSTDSPPAVADLDGNGKLEIVVGSMWLGDRNGRVGVYRAKDRKLLWEQKVPGCVQSAPSLVDLNGDKVLDVIVTSWGGDRGVYAFSGKKGKLLWRFQTETRNPRSKGMYHGVTVSGNVQKRRLIVTTCDGDVYALDARGKKIWNEHLSGEYLFAPTSIADLNGDRKEEVVVGGRSLYVFRVLDGKLLWKKPLKDTNHRGSAIVDADGDGDLDVVYIDKTVLRVRDGKSGKEIMSFDGRVNKGDRLERVSSAPLVADFDGDGALDVFFITGRGYSGKYKKDNFGRGWALRLGGKGKDWPVFRGNLRRTGRVDQQ